MKTEIKMISRIWSKKETQKIIKMLRNAGVPVKKIDSGYECKDKKGNIYFKAMIGNNGYLVRYAEKLFKTNN